jgi:hypothetical protein
MRTVVTFLISTLLLAALSSCGLLFGGDDDSLPGPGNNGGGNNNGDSAFDVFASAGATPTFTWEGGDAHSVAVVLASNPADIKWAVAFVGLSDGIASGVAYGEVPAGSVQAVAPAALQPGTEYRVSVARADGTTVGWTEFTP